MAPIYNSNDLAQITDFEKKSETIINIQNFFEHASKNNIKLGYLRGPCFSDLNLRKLIRTEPYFLNLKLFPDIWLNGGLNFSMDVEFERGKELIDHFKDFKIFRLPMVDIINKTKELIEEKIPFENYLDNSPEFLSLFKNGKLDQVWGFDQKPTLLPYEDLFRNENLYSIEDTLNLYLISTIGASDLLREYRDRKNSSQKGNEDILSFLLKQNFGTIIYHEDIIEIIHHFTGWSHLKCDLLRRNLKNNNDGGKDWEECSKIIGTDIATRILKSGKNTFSKAHLFSSYTLIRKSLVLRNFFEKPYFNSSELFEQKFSIPWNYYEA